MDNETKTLLEYLPPFLREYYEFKQLCKSGDIEVSSIYFGLRCNHIVQI